VKWIPIITISTPKIILITHLIIIPTVCPLFHILFALIIMPIISHTICFNNYSNCVSIISHTICFIYRDSYLLPISQISFISTFNFTNLIHIYFQYHKKLFNLLPKKLSMDPFDIEAYFQKRDIEDTYIVNRFIQREKN